MRLIFSALVVALLSACTPTAQLTPEPPNPADPTPSFDSSMGSEAATPATLLTGSGRALSSIERTLSGGILEIGHADASATLTVFVAPTARYSRMFLTDHWPNLLHTFVDKGTLKIHVTPFVLESEPTSHQHAEAIHCAAKQGRGRMMLEALARDIRPTQAMKDVSADTKAFDACLIDPVNQPIIEWYKQLAIARRVAVVPAFFLGSFEHAGVSGEADFHGWIREALQAN